MRTTHLLTAGLFAFTVLASLTSDAVIHGTVARSESSKNTVYIFNSKTSNICTGTVIHPRVILTAGHCVLNKKPGWFSFSNSVEAKSTNTKSLKVLKVLARPGYCGDVKGTQSTSKGRNDIGYILFEDSVLPSLKLTMADLPDLASSREKLEIAFSQAKDFELIGYGFNSKPLHSDQKMMKMRYSLTASIEEGGKQISAKGVTPGQSSCFGDSGGPLFAINGSSRKTLVGVLTSIRAGGQLLERHKAEKAKLLEKAKAKLAKKGKSTTPEVTFDANGCEVDPLAAATALPAALLTQVCGDVGTSQSATTIYPHICWIQTSTGITLDPNLNCTGDH